MEKIESESTARVIVPGKALSASEHRRLKNQAKRTHRPFGSLAGVVMSTMFAKLGLNNSFKTETPVYVQSEVDKAEALFSAQQKRERKKARRAELASRS